MSPAHLCEFMSNSRNGSSNSCTSAETLPDPQHCDKLGSPSYYSKGYSNGHARSES